MEAGVPEMYVNARNSLEIAALLETTKIGKSRPEEWFPQQVGCCSFVPARPFELLGVTSLNILYNLHTSMFVRELRLHLPIQT
jgi:hypothetical protein